MIYVVFPCYNEGNAVAELIESTAISMEENQLHYTIVAVNDASTDNTHEIIARYRDKYPIFYIRNETNKNYGGALWEGLRWAIEDSAERDIIITMDGDNTHTPGLILRMVRHIREGSDVVIASRYRRGARVIGYSVFKRAISRVGNIIYKVIMPVRGVLDYTSGFRAYQSALLRKAYQTYGDQLITKNDFVAVTEIISKMRRFQPLIVHETPLIYRYDRKEQKSKMNLKKAIRGHLSMVRETLIKTENNSWLSSISRR
jgi:dolichol-phosphate mannosyltransferase